MAVAYYNLQLPKSEKPGFIVFYNTLTYHYLRQEGCDYTHRLSMPTGQQGPPYTKYATVYEIRPYLGTPMSEYGTVRLRIRLTRIRTIKVQCQALLKSNFKFDKYFWHWKL